MTVIASAEADLLLKMKKVTGFRERRDRLGRLHFET